MKKNYFLMIGLLLSSLTTLASETCSVQDEGLNESAKPKTTKNDVVRKSIQVNDDLTHLIVNSNFAEGEKGWTFEKTSVEGNVHASAADKMAEGWKATYDIHQEISGMPVGCYVVYAHAFYRENRDEASWRLYFDWDTKERKAQVPESKAYIYLNDAKTKVPDIFTDQQMPGFYPSGYYAAPDGYVYPNDMVSARVAFDHRMYSVNTLGLVAKEGDVLRIGMKGDYPDADNWATFTDFELVYLGIQDAIIAPLLEEALNKLMSIDKPMAADVLAELATIVDNYYAALVIKDAKAMFDVLAAAYAIESKIEASIAHFEQCESKIVELDDAIADSNASTETIDEAEVLLDQLNNSYFDMTDAELVEAIAAVDAMIKKLMIPANIDEANYNNPIEITKLITNPSFESGDLAGWTVNTKATGDTGVKANTGVYTLTNADGMYVFNTWNGDGVDGGFFISQTVSGLPRTGYYTVKALAASDAGNVIALSATQGTTTEKSEITIAGNNGTAENIECKFMVNDISEDVVISMSSNTWFKADGFQLFYYGKEDPTAIDVVGCKASTIAKKDIITIGGAARNSLEQGVNIVRFIKADGSVEVKKIIVK